MKRKDIIAIILLALATIAVIAVAWVLFTKPQGAPASTTIVDHDTGETFNTSENSTSTGGGLAATNAYFFGIEKFINTLKSDGYENTDLVSDVKTAINNYSDARLNNKFITLTLRPQNLSVSKAVINGQLRLGETNAIVPIQIIPSNTDEAAIVTINKGSSSHGGVYVYVGGVNNQGNLQFTIRQKNTTSTDLIISTFSNREAALQYIEQIGYNVPDFSISFANNYKNPFL